MSIKNRTLFKVFGNPSASTSQVGEILRIMRPEHVNAINSKGRSVLMEAIIAGHSEDVILALLEKQPDPTIMDYEEETALHHATRHASANVVERMLELGFDVSARNAYTQTPLLVAVKNTKDERVIHLLQEHGADIEENTVDNSGVMLHAAGNKHLNLLPYFKSLGLSDTVIDDSGKNCLHNGIIHDLPVERIKALLHLPFVSAPKKPLELTEEELEYATYKSRIPSAMILASIYSSDSAVLQLLIDRGASVEDCDDVFKRTPLMHAVVNERPKEFIELLIEAGTDLLAVDRDRMIALELAILHNYDTEIFKMLVEEYGKLEGAGKVLAKAASYSYDPEILKYLIDSGADINAQTFSPTGQTALMWLCEGWYDYLHEQRHEINYNADSNISFDDVHDYAFEEIKLLVDNGADIAHIKDAEGLTGLDYLKDLLSDKEMDELTECLLKRDR